MIDEKTIQTFKEKSINITEEFELYRGLYKTKLIKIERCFNGYGYVYNLTFKGLEGLKHKEKILDDVEFECEYQMSKQLELLFKEIQVDFLTDLTLMTVENEWTIILKTKPTLIIEHCNLNRDDISFTESHIQLKHFKICDIF